MSASNFQDLLAQIYNLTPSERVALKEALGVPLTHLVAERKRKHAEYYIEKMNEIIGDDVRSRRRDAMLVNARAALCHILRDETYTFAEIGRMLNRNHSTIMNACYLMEDALALPSQYPDVIHVYNKFKQAIGQ